MIESLNAAFLRDLRAYNRVLQLLDENRDAFHRLYRLAGLTDTAAALLSFQKSLPFSCSPDFHVENKQLFDAVYHPLLGEPVPNTGSFSPNILITGSNASGKSTFLKALAINAILAQSVCICCARQFALRPGPVISSMAMRDSLMGGESYFIAEIKSLKRILEAAQTAYCICFVDEILRGTNSIERIAASAAVLNQLRRRDCLCVVASHDLELANILKSGYESWHFSETVTTAGVEFDYLLKPGPSDTRNAILLLEQMGFSPSLVRDARYRAETLAARKIL